MNWSKNIYKDTPLNVCFSLGQTHKAYGWAKHTDGGWSAEQVAEYVKGYEGKSTSEILEESNSEYEQQMADRFGHGGRY